MFLAARLDAWLRRGRKTFIVSGLCDARVQFPAQTSCAACDDQRTIDLASAVPGYSAQYDRHPDSAAQRHALYRIRRRTPRWYIADSYDGGDEQGSWPSAWGFQGGWGVRTCCGHARLQRKTIGRANGLNQLVSVYQKYFISQIDPQGRDDLNKQVAQWQQNDADIQALVKKNYPGGLLAAAQTKRG